MQLVSRVPTDAVGAVSLERTLEVRVLFLQIRGLQSNKLSASLLKGTEPNTRSASLYTILHVEYNVCDTIEDADCV